MNYLAHLFLAGEHQETVVGNFIADHVKGDSIGQFNNAVREGILMHRAVDTFTDSHPVVKRSILRLRPVYRKYAGVIVDMYYDHFLAAGWEEYSSVSLEEFTRSRYDLLLSYAGVIPARSQRILQHMSEHNWLLSYRSLDGLHQALTGMSRRTTFVSRMEHAVLDLKDCYDCYREEFRIFFPELCGFVESTFSGMITKK